MSPEELAAAKADAEIALRRLYSAERESAKTRCAEHWVHELIEAVEAQASEIERLRAREAGLEERLEWQVRNFVKERDGEVQKQAAEIERLRGYETAARDLDGDLTKIASEKDELQDRIQELEDALVEERARRAEECPRDVTGSWQVTGERKAAIDAALEYMSDGTDEDGSILSHIRTLRAMLEEVEG